MRVASARKKTAGGATPGGRFDVYDGADLFGPEPVAPAAIRTRYAAAGGNLPRGPEPVNVKEKPCQL